MAKINETRTVWWAFAIKNPVHRKKPFFSLAAK